LCPRCTGSASVYTVDGSELQLLGETDVSIGVNDYEVKISCMVARKLLPNVEVILGMDVIRAVGGVMVTGRGVEFPNIDVCASGLTPRRENIRIEDKDFVAEFDGTSWKVRWIWKGDPPTLRNRVAYYESTLSSANVDEYEEQIRDWISNGWLEPCDESDSGILPLMAVDQPSKNKVRPVLDYRELNDYVSCHTGDYSPACDETIRKWRKMTGHLAMVDLRNAYLQIKVDESLWRYQKVRYKGKMYYLTRLGFGLNCAPRIMTRILGRVLEEDEIIRQGTDHYIDDIIVNEDIVSAEDVIKHLYKFGLKTKAPEGLESARVLGLQLFRSKNDIIMFRRGKELPLLDFSSSTTRRNVFSVCGKLVGHYPVAGWLRVACSYIKRCCEGSSWDDDVGPRALHMLEEVMNRVENEDPVRGNWYVGTVAEGTVWCDASNLALGVALEIDGSIVEDASWLRKSSDSAHINVAELDAALKGINLAIKWGLSYVKVNTDSVTVKNWLSNMIEGSCKVKSKGAAEMLIKRRLSTLSDLINEYEIHLTVELVRSEENKADVLTRVKKEWTKNDDEIELEICGLTLTEIHNRNHFGVENTFYLARKLLDDVTKEEVEKCVRNCEQCQSIDPAPSRHESGKIDVDENWIRLAVDTTHFNEKCYLTLIDCGPSRFAIWRLVSSENSVEVIRHLDEIFRERGPPEELLMDNSATFHSKRMETLCEQWNIVRRYRAAHRPSGNGIVERNHRTVKRVAKRSKISPLQAVFWYNMVPRSEGGIHSVPSTMLHRYSFRDPDQCIESEECPISSVKIGEKVWVKPPDAKCTTKWKLGTVTKIASPSNVEVDNCPRHILDVRRMFNTDEEDECDGGTPEREVNDIADRPQRQRRPPIWLNDFN